MRALKMLQDGGVSTLKGKVAWNEPPLQDDDVKVWKDFAAHCFEKAEEKMEEEEMIGNFGCIKWLATLGVSGMESQKSVILNKLCVFYHVSTIERLLYIRYTLDNNNNINWLFAFVISQGSRQLIIQFPPRVMLCGRHPANAWHVFPFSSIPF